MKSTSTDLGSIGEACALAEACREKYLFPLFDHPLPRILCLTKSKLLQRLRSVQAVQQLERGQDKTIYRVSYVFLDALE